VTMLFLALFIGYSMRIPQEKIGTFGALCSIPNSAYLGYPIILSILGEKALTYAVIYDTGACLALWTVVISIIRRGARLKANWQQILNPALASVLLALTTNVSGLKLPETILEPIRIMGQATVPLAMTALGYSFLQMKSTVTENHGILITTALVKLILYPLLAYAVLNLFPLDPMFKAVVVIIAAMPSMAGTPIIVEKFGGDLGFATSGVFFTTTLSLLTIPLLLYVLG
jgi:predicted permease